MPPRLVAVARLSSVGVAAPRGYGGTALRTHFAAALRQREASALALGRRLETAGYRIEVVDVEVPYEISAGRIAGRWQQSYEKALTGENTLGGRWVPSEYAHDVFNGPGGKSKPEAAAQKLAETCPAVDRYRLWRTTAEGTATTPPVGSWEKDLTR